MTRGSDLDSWEPLTLPSGTSFERCHQQFQAHYASTQCPKEDRNRQRSPWRPKDITFLRLNNAYQMYQLSHSGIQKSQLSSHYPERTEIEGEDSG